ncbi:GNAT family N-acetyltransferase [Dongia soli]|uniref:GNAT family N-acetyltransferase n=1 Tax=Dongia soli TaxID=600628 RepID=A0ABU5EBC7_9PROT|nr:GNAT family N-acetyltransferase [Dongia soli]MDY0883493.1 GNAT family N-acetyltransferase [Dongia soli]
MIETPRLLLRNCRESDLPAFAALNADPQVTEFLPKQLSREESDAMAARIRTLMTIQDFGFWGGRGARWRRFHRLRRPASAELRSAFHTLYGNRLASCT